MDPHFLYEFAQTILRELSRKRLLATVLFCLTSLVVLIVGIVWPLKYETSATLYVDEKNIIEPLLQGQAEVQEVDQAREAKEQIYTRHILESVARNAGLVDESTDPKVVARILARLASPAGIQISNSGQNYIKLSYRSTDAEESFNIITALIEAFIRNIAESKRQESQEAFNFIQQQVELYKEQLKVAEQKLEKFTAQNLDDGTEASINKRIADLRSQLEELSLQTDELETRRNSIKKQLSSEREYLTVRTEADIHRQRLSEAQSRLETLLITYTDTHPDVISLKLQIQDIKQVINDIEQREPQSQNSNSNLALNPLFEQLRSTLSETEISLSANRHRIQTITRLLEEEYARAKRFASTRGELAELNRDYDVTKGLYEDMLTRKEKARLSMTLDIEGQGTSYKVHEPPTFPLNPTGIKPTHFMSLAPLAGLAVPLGLVAAFIFLDPRIRLPSDLKLLSNSEVLTVIPPASNATLNHYLKRDTILAAFLLVGSSALFGWIALNTIVGAAT